METTLWGLGFRVMINKPPPFNGLYRDKIIILGLYEDNGKENGNYSLGFRV